MLTEKEILFRKVKWAQRIMGKEKEFEVSVAVAGKHDDMSRHSCVHVLCESRDTKAAPWHAEKICQEVNNRDNREN